MLNITSVFFVQSSAGKSLGRNVAIFEYSSLIGQHNTNGASF